MDRSGLVALTLSAAISFAAAVGLAGMGFETGTPVLPAVWPDPVWHKPSPPDVFPMDDGMHLTPPEPVRDWKPGSLIYILG